MAVYRLVVACALSLNIALTLCLLMYISAFSDLELLVFDVLGVHTKYRFILSYCAYIYLLIIAIMKIMLQS